MVMFEIKPKWIKYLRRLRLERILANCTTLTTNSVNEFLYLLRMVPPFVAVHMFCASWDGPRYLGFLRTVPTNTTVFLCGL